MSGWDHMGWNIRYVGMEVRSMHSSHAVMLGPAGRVVITFYISRAHSADNQWCMHMKYIIL